MVQCDFQIANITRTEATVAKVCNEASTTELTEYFDLFFVQKIHMYFLCTVVL